ncbi:MAG: hypothetical protein BWK80_29840 [Desulfobacteraceae bacterium IS3]|jgi:hypothetical protein|nr:MAG: hypothetical protein BWK80_29840 [Desulfobacteraceae bacterium IS3]HAO22981.1 hypothetical protein [Desulfobacteraceae bacterium]
MALTLADILEDLHSIFESLHKFEQRYLLGSEVFYELYMQGLLDDGSYAEEFAEWAGHCKLRQKREAALKSFSRQRVEQLRLRSDGHTIRLMPREELSEAV